MLSAFKTVIKLDSIKNNVFLILDCLKCIWKFDLLFVTTKDPIIQVNIYWISERCFWNWMPKKSQWETNLKLNIVLSLFLKDPQLFKYLHFKSKMSLKISPDFFKSCDFELLLKVIDKFVEKVLSGSDKQQKRKLVEKIKNISKSISIVR